jgi:hypothetical protein
LSRATARLALAVGIVSFVVYALTAYPDLPGGDSGELIAAIATGGVIHPPGYPLYSLLGRFFVHLPLGGGVAWRLNLMSAACDAGAAALVTAAVGRWRRSALAGATAGGVFALSPVVWRYAVCAEVFALNNLLCAALLWLAVVFDEREDGRVALRGAFVTGLGFANHHTFVFMAAPIVAWSLWRSPALRAPRMLGAMAIAACAGLLPYVLLPVQAARSAPVSWGEANAWSGFWTHVLRREYGTFQLAVTGITQGGAPGATLAAWASEALEQVGVWGAPLPLLGAAVVLRGARKAPFGAVLLVPAVLAVGALVVLGNLPVSDPLHREIVSRFWQMPGLIVSVLCGVGVGEIEARFSRAAAAVVALAVTLGPVPFHWGPVSRHGNTLVRSYGSEILRAAPPGALLLTKGDLITNGVRYLQTVEGMRPDVRVLDQELLGYPWEPPRVRRAHPEVNVPGARYMPGAPDGFTMKELLDANPSAPAVLICGGVKPGDVSADLSYGRWPWGFCERVHPGNEPVSVDDWIRESEAALPRIDFGAQARPPGSWEAVVWGDFWEVRQARAAHLLAVAGADPARRRFIAVAAEILEGIVKENPQAPPHVYKNLALALGRRGLETDAQKKEAAAAWKKYLETGPLDDPQRSAIEKEVARLEGR